MGRFSENVDGNFSEQSISDNQLFSGYGFGKVDDKLSELFLGSYRGEIDLGRFDGKLS